MDSLEELMNDTPPHAPVYCGTCVFYMPPETCGHPHGYGRIENPVAPRHAYSTVHERNAQNDCPDYMPNSLRSCWRAATFTGRAKMAFGGLVVFAALALLLERSIVAFPSLRHFLGF